MPYALSILMRYRYWILASLSLLLISEMVVAGIDLVPIEHEWVFGCLLFLTTMVWVGMVGLIGVVAPVSGDIMKRVYRILAYFSLVLFLMGFLPILLGGALAWLFWQWYWLFLFMVWIGIVVVVGAIANAEPERSTEISLHLRVFSIVMIAWLGMVFQFWTIEMEDESFVLLISLFVVVSNSLTLGVVTLRTMLADRRRTLLLYIMVVLTSIGISTATYSIAVVLGILSTAIVGISSVFVLALLVAIPGSVLWTALIGTMRRSVRNVTVAGIGMLVMILVVGWYWHQTMDNGLYAFSGEERAAAERALKSARCPDTPLHLITIRIVKSDDGEFLLRGYTWWRISTGDCHQP